jgi:hypothetical protein
MTKIICVGFHKTGTTSLGRALQILGYSVIGARTMLARSCSEGDLTRIYDLMDQFDACEDNPWAVLFKELDERYPGSRFILTLRDSESWRKSALNHFGHRKTAMRKWIYGRSSIVGYEDLYVERMERHNEEVRAYFAERPADLLELRLTEGEGWEKLCPFLEQQVPSVLFPHLNHRQKRPVN